MILTYYWYYAIIDSLVYQILIEHWLSARYCSRVDILQWTKQSPCLHGSYILSGFVNLDCNFKIPAKFNHTHPHVTFEKLWEVGRVGTNRAFHRWRDLLGFSSSHLVESRKDWTKWTLSGETKGLSVWVSMHSVYIPGYPHCEVWGSWTEMDVGSTCFGASPFPPRCPLRSVFPSLQEVVWNEEEGSAGRGRALTPQLSCLVGWGSSTSSGSRYSHVWGHCAGAKQWHSHLQERTCLSQTAQQTSAEIHRESIDRRTRITRVSRQEAFLKCSDAHSLPHSGRAGCEKHDGAALTTHSLAFSFRITFPLWGHWQGVSLVVRQGRGPFLQKASRDREE